MIKTGRVGRLVLGFAALLVSIFLIRAVIIPFISEELTTSHGLIKTDVPTLQLRPDFSAIDNVSEKKQVFFSYFRPLVVQENAIIAAERKLIESVISHLHSGDKLTDAEHYQLNKISQRYRHTLTSPVSIDELEDLLLKVDTIPVDLVLVQAANESGWGSSRFSKQGNNFFGQWCFSQGCGLVPLSRTPGLTHEVASFDSPKASVIAYMNNLNTNNAYKMFRSIRYDKRLQQQTPKAEELVYGLIHYSERKEAYIDELLQMLKHNKKLLQGLAAHG